MNTQKLHNNIMRRIYYAYAIRVVTNPALMHGFFMLAMIIALSYFVSIGNVIQNLMGAQVSHVGTFAYNAITNTEAWTLLILGAIIFSALSLRFTLGSRKKSTQELAHQLVEV